MTTFVMTMPRRVWFGLGACLLLLILVLVPWQAGQAAPGMPTLDLAIAPASAMPGTTVRLVAMVRMPTASAPATLTLDIPMALEAVTVTQDPGGCVVATTAVTCTTLVGPQAPATLVVEGRLSVLVQPGLLTVTASAVVSGTAVPASASLLVIAGAPAATVPPFSPTVPPTIPPLVPPATPGSGGLTPAPFIPPATVLPSATASLTTSPVTVLSPTPAPLDLDAAENNYDIDHATVLLPGLPLTMTLVSPGGAAVSDVDYVTFFVPAQRCATLATTALEAGIDTNIEVLDHTGTVLVGNDDATPTTHDSQVRWCAETDTVLFARIAQSARTPLVDLARSFYRVLLTIDILVAPTPPLPVSSPTTGASVPSLPLPPAAPDAPVVAGSPAGDSPVTTIEITSGATTGVPCTPLLDVTQVVTDSAILAGVEACEDRATIVDSTIPTGEAHVAIHAAALYHGPGAQYSRLAVLPAAYRVRLTGATRNGWVAVALTDRTGVPPLIGWMWGPYLVVDRWDAGAVDIPLPVSPAGAGDLPATGVPAESAGLPVATTGPAQGSPSSPLGTPLTFHVVSGRTTSLTVLVCRQRSGEGRCASGQGIGQVPLVVTAANGDVLAQGITDATGRWIGRVARRSDAIAVAAPLIGMTSSASLTTADLVVSLIVQPAVIPPTFR